MRLRKVTIRNFRGISRLCWNLKANTNFVALIGPGDSTKTTILDAIGLALTSRYSVSVTDADFCNGNTSEPILIEVVVADLPEALLEERSQGKNRSGIHPDGRMEHDPIEEDDVVECLVVRLSVDSTLEPVWEVVRPGDTEGVRVSAAERAQLGFFRIGDLVDQNLRWSRGSALTSLTASKSDVSSAVIEAQRQAQKAIRDLEDTPLHTAASFVSLEAGRLGCGPFADLRPGLDPAIGAGSSALLLHDGTVPLTQFGLGSRRLLGLAIQENALKGQTIVAIDEVEAGLDPHRLHHLIRHLRERSARGELQVILTTHAPLVVEALDHDQVFIVRSRTHTTTVQGVPEDLVPKQLDLIQGVVRERPSSLLAQRVIVGEGATEVGFVRQLLHEWDAAKFNQGDSTSVTMGASVMNGSGSSYAPRRAASLATLDYPTLLVIDGDVTENAGAITGAKEAGAGVLQWPQGQALEDVIFTESSTACVGELLVVAAEERGEDSVISAIGARFENTQLRSLKVEEWFSTYGEDHVRQAIASAAKGQKTKSREKDESKAWFKRESLGSVLARIVLKHEADLQGEILRQGMSTIRAFVYGGAQPANSGSTAEA